MRTVGGFGIHLAVQPANPRAGRLEGLLGDFDGNAANDLRFRNGNPIDKGVGRPSFALLYPAFAEGWRIEASGSLFSYTPGTTTETFTDRTVPEVPTHAERLPGYPAAAAVCQRVGVTEPQILADCVLDVALTGQAAFALAARDSQEVESVRFGRVVTLPATANIYRAGRLAVTSLPGGAGSLPLQVPFDPASTEVITFPVVSGTIGPWRSSHHGPDGGPEFHGTDIVAFNGFPGVRHRSRSLYLVGVFMPSGAGIPPQLDLSDRERVDEYMPARGELFYIGDGRSASGAVQRFVVPTGATALYVGFADAIGFRGKPGAYDDNTGWVTIHWEAQRKTKAR